MVYFPEFFLHKINSSTFMDLCICSVYFKKKIARALKKTFQIHKLSRTRGNPESYYNTFNVL